jgi:4'-phosphopantetheinyl transferase
MCQALATVRQRAHPALGSGDVHVWTIRLDLLRADADPAASDLAPRERERARRFRFPLHRDRYAATHTAKRRILSRSLGVKPADVGILEDSVGRPRVDPACHEASFDFNLSHSHDVALLAVSSSRVGIDVEFENRAVDCDALVRRNFSRAEAEEYLWLPAGLRRRALFAARTVKEACLKASGTGLGDGLESYAVTMHPDQPPRLLAQAGRPGNETRWRLARLARSPARRA